MPIKTDSTSNRNINTNPTDIDDDDDDNAAKAMSSSVEPVATEHGTTVSTTALPPPESTTTSIQLEHQQKQWTGNSKPKIKHEIPAAIDSDDQQQFDIGGSAALHRPFPATVVLSRTKATHKQAKADGKSEEGDASEATLQQDGNRKSSASRSMHSTDNPQGHRGSGGGGNATATDAGTITNLMSDDAFNVMSFVKIAHYVWAIPLKVKS